MTTWLVTGGAGFIGSHLCDALVARGDRVRVLDDLSTGSKANLAPEVALTEGDVADPATVSRAVEGVDGCFHLAAIASVEKGVSDWLGTHRVNLTGTIALFESIRRQASRIPVVYASSAAVYGDCRTTPITEDAVCAPLSAYGADKYGCEQHARVASHVFGIPTTGLRFFNVYGPRQDPRSPYSGVISIFCERIAAGKPISVFGDGAQTRDFIHVSDVVAALLSAMSPPPPLPMAENGLVSSGEIRPGSAVVFNVCTGIATSVQALSGLIAELSGKKLDIRREPPRSGEIRHSLGAPALADQRLRLGGRLPLRDGLAGVLAWLALPH